MARRFSLSLFPGSHHLDTRTPFGASGRRSPNWHDSSRDSISGGPTAGSERSTDPRRDAEFTLGLDDEWEDVPTAELRSAEYDEATADVEAPQAPVAEVAATSAGQVASVDRGARAAKSSVGTPVQGSRAPALHGATLEPAASPVTPTARTPVAPPTESAAAAAPKDIARDVATGSLLCNRYLLGRMLGVGGSSLIFQAEDRRRIGAQDFGSRIAIKVLRPEMRHNSHALTRLKREFRQMQRLSHPGVARVFELACDEDVWFTTMELIEGQTINQWLKAGANRTEGLRLISACCEALTHAHEAGVVHGDLKPSNVLVLAGGGVKLVDFGSAAERDVATGEIDKERSFAATPPYASPQVLAGEVAEPRDDVFSLACLTYAVLTNGEHPFERKSSAQAQQAQLRPTYARAIHPRQFEAIVRGLAWDRDQRPSSVREFLNALLVSDWRREANARDGSSVDVSSRRGHAWPVSPEIAPAPNVESAAPPPLVREPQVSFDPKPKPAVKLDDVAHLKAAVAAAEAHAARAEKRKPTEPEPTGAGPAAKGQPQGGDPLDRFRGYVAGPLAKQSDDIDTPVAAEFAAEPAAPSRKAKRIWPWHRSVLIALVIASTTALFVTQFDFDAEPIRQAAARPEMRSTATPRAPVATQTAAISAPARALQVEEKKSAPVALKPARPLAAGEVSFATRTLQVGANQTMAALSVTRQSSTRGRARVAWTIEGGTARRGVHYELTNPPMIEFLDGQSVRSLFIPLMPDKDAANARHSKTFTVKLQQAAGGPALGAIKQVHVTIVGDVVDEKIAALPQSAGG